MSNANERKDGFVVGANPVSRKRSTKPIDVVDESRGDSDSRDDDDEQHTHKKTDKPAVIFAQSTATEAELQDNYVHTGGYQHKDFPSYVITGYRLKIGGRAIALLHQRGRSHLVRDGLDPKGNAKRD